MNRRIDWPSALVSLVQHLLAGIHDVVGIKCALDLEHYVPAATHLLWDQLGVAGSSAAVAGGDRAAVLQRHLRDLGLEVDPAGPGLVVEFLLPDPDVDLGEVVAPGLVRR